MKKTLFVQPRHSYAFPYGEGEGHVYTPTSMWTQGSRLLQGGADISFADENLAPADYDNADIVGFNLVGAPYIPIVRKIIQETLNDDRPILIGGQAANGLSEEQIKKLFGNNAMHFPYQTEPVTGADAVCVPLPEETSLIPSYEKISDEAMREYLSPQREISLYLSQGCAFDCVFCGAERNMPEKYRNLTLVKKDLQYLTDRAKRFGYDQLKMYLSNLDIFQSPEQFNEFCRVIETLHTNNPGFRYHWRGLATAAMTVRIAKKFPKVLQRAVDTGLEAVGIGVDGGDERVWRAVKKGHNNKFNILKSMSVCKHFGITPETIMVFGHPQENRETLENAVYLTHELQHKYGAVPRPHVSKDLIPGNKYWNETVENATEAERADRAVRIKLLFEHPEYFQALDFKALPSSVSHTNVLLRHMVDEYYRRITAMCDTKEDRESLIYPIAPEFSDLINDLHRYWNMGRFDR